MFISSCHQHGDGVQIVVRISAELGCRIYMQRRWDSVESVCEGRWRIVERMSPRCVSGFDEDRLQFKLAAQLREFAVSPLNEDSRFSIRGMIVIDQRGQLRNAFLQRKVFKAPLLIRSPGL
jgi:hypothetical protein